MLFGWAPLWAFLQVTAPSEWQQVPAPAELRQVAVGRADHVWAVSTRNQVFKHLGGGKWEPIEGPSKQIAVGADGDVWRVDLLDQVWQYQGGQRWYRYQLSLSGISAARKDLVWGVTRKGEIWQRSGSRWIKVAGAARQLSVGTDGVVWTTAEDGSISRSPGTDRWERIPGKLLHVSAGNAQAVWGVATDGRLVQWRSGTWQFSPRTATQVSAAADGTVWAVAKDGTAWRLGGDVPTDLNAYFGEKARELAGDLWARVIVPNRYHQLDYVAGTAEEFRQAAQDFGRELTPKLRASMGANGNSDLALAALTAEMETFVNRFVSRVKTAEQVLTRIDPLCAQAKKELPPNATDADMCHPNVWGPLRISVGVDLRKRFPNGAPTTAEQQAAMAHAVSRVEAWTKEYAEARLTEWRTREEQRKKAPPPDCRREKKLLGVSIPYFDPGCLMKKLGNVFQDIWNRASGWLSDALAAVTRLAKGSWEGVKKGATWVAVKAVDAAKWVAEKAAKAFEKLAALCPRFQLTEFLATSPWLYLWKCAQAKFLELVKGYAEGLLESAKKELQKLLERALAATDPIFEKVVIVPAATAAAEEIFGRDPKPMLDEVVARLLGQPEEVERREQAIEDAFAALLARDVVKLDQALARCEIPKEPPLERIADVAAAYLRERLVEIVRGKAVQFLGDALELAEKPIEEGKAAAISGVASIPVVGPSIAAGADVVVAEGVKRLRSAILKHVADKVPTLLEPWVSQVRGSLAGGAGKIDTWLAPILGRVRSSFGDVQKQLAQSASAYRRLVENLGRARQKLGGAK